MGCVKLKMIKLTCYLACRGIRTKGLCGEWDLNVMIPIYLLSLGSVSLVLKCRGDALPLLHLVVGCDNTRALLADLPETGLPSSPKGLHFISNQEDLFP